MLLTCIAPPAVMMLVWSGPPPPTVAEVLHAAHARVTGNRP
jgi:hypothetical protein